MCHMVFKPISPDFRSDNHDILLWDSDWLAALRTDIHAHRTLASTMLELETRRSESKLTVSSRSQQAELKTEHLRKNWCTDLVGKILMKPSILSRIVLVQGDGI